MLKVINYWPPYFASGIGVKETDQNLFWVDVRLVQKFYNTNYVGSHYGGSLYSMCDPFYMFILIHHLGKEHIVWDQAAEIEFVRPAKGTVTARFEIPQVQIESIRTEALVKFSLRPEFVAEVKDEQGQVVARVKKVLYVRRKDAKERFAQE